MLEVSADSDIAYGTGYALWNRGVVFDSITIFYWWLCSVPSPDCVPEYTLGNEDKSSEFLANEIVLANSF